ncbi:Uncharacterized protein TPAR_03658 [Tolypocladium paradoxum]|uniref:Protein kinase domain-containing protein n=1 Tax=Tolypocladium paradoxum TaxID=94208 RepID=A0A2S4L130_9HYPO|nr:Uncharacterized protein TPAR_03658 [Tolypocladium paradoxum]
MASPDTGNPSNRKAPTVTSLQDLAIMEAWDTETNKPKYVTFYLVTSDDELYFGHSTKNKRELTLAEYNSALEHVSDDEIYPAVPSDIALTIAPDYFNDASSFIKRPGLTCYKTMKGSGFVPKALLDETLIMEQVSQTQHPNIVRYHGCRVRRGRITAIVLERLDQTLMQYAATPAFEQLDKSKFIEALESAVDYIHSLGLAHNDINPDNIMVRDGMPVLIDFGSCQPYGKRLQSLGTQGWYEELFYTSEKKHDEYSLGILREWLQKPKLRSWG